MDRFRIACAACVVGLVLAAGPALAQAPGPKAPTLLSELHSDLAYTINNAQDDLIDVVTSPLLLPRAPELLKQRVFYYTLLGGGALLGAGFALDNTIHSKMRHISSSDADTLQSTAEVFTWVLTAPVYAYGLLRDDQRAREGVITGYEGAGIASLLVLGLKPAFGRLRPFQYRGPFKFFDGGSSFPSGDATPLFAIAAGISEAADYRWYVALPAYGGAIAVGLGRMAHDAHWTSDIVFSALLGAGTTELLWYLHRRHPLNPNRFRFITVGSQSSAGVGIAFNW